MTSQVTFNEVQVIDIRLFNFCVDERTELDCELQKANGIKVTKYFVLLDPIIFRQEGLNNNSLRGNWESCKFNGGRVTGGRDIKRTEKIARNRYMWLNVAC